MNEKIKYDSIPVYYTSFDFFHLGSGWSVQDWIAWYSILEATDGQTQAVSKFVKAFRNAPFGSPTIDFRTFDSEFKDFAKENGFYDALFTGVLGTIAKAENTAGDVVNSGLDAVGGTFTGLNSIIQTLKEYIPIIIVLAGLILLYVFYSRIKKA
jgi:hypothetical protein